MNSKKSNPLVIDIKGNSMDDGPGMRSVVFFKGCPLECVWCQNPESKSKEPELMFDKSKCIKCGECIKECPAYAISFSNKDLVLDRNKCIKCFKCTDVCPAMAFSRAGKEMDINAIMEKILPYKSFFSNSGGGVTFSGGEPTLNIDFLSQLIKSVKEHEIHTLIETSGLFKLKEFEEKIIPHIDTIFMDIKFIDKESHKKYCGVDNKIILENFSYINKKADEMDFEILPRTPLIPGITDTEKNISEIIEFYKRNNVTKAGLMKNNPIWFDKNEKLGIQKAEFPEDSEARLFYDSKKFDEIKNKFRENGITVIEY